MILILVIYVFVIGLLLGSFINMAVYRNNRDESLWGRSYCDISGHKLNWYDLLPIISFFIFGGRCRQCKQKISVLYPFVELISGLSMVFIFVQSFGLDVELTINNFIKFIVYGSFVFIMLYFAVFDYQYWSVDLYGLLFAFSTGIYLHIFLSISQIPLLVSWYWALGSAIIWGGIILLVYKLTKGGGMGVGDIYLWAFVGLILGPINTFVAFVITTNLGALYGIILAIYIKNMKGLIIPFAPFISIGSIISLFYAERILLFIDNLIYYLLY
jgi:prepilin signal peptidase PulO-like enzyme (type II secretory pathway)